MMRLRANTLWPAMHECTVPFHFVKDARETTEKYGIIIGTSHCEPMTRNSAGEWSDQLNGPYNFVTNSNNVIRYWKERLLKVGQKENIYTIGMRGRHDGRMQGVALGRWESILLRKTPSHFTHFNKRGRRGRQPLQFTRETRTTLSMKRSIFQKDFKFRQILFLAGKFK